MPFWPGRLHSGLAGLEVQGRMHAFSCEGSCGDLEAFPDRATAAVHQRLLFLLTS